MASMPPARAQTVENAWPKSIAAPWPAPIIRRNWREPARDPTAIFLCAPRDR
jgi:hypothetical protein